MSLTDLQIKDLAQKMNVPLVFCDFKDQLKGKLKYNKSYIINMDNELDEDGKPNGGSHYTCFQVNKYPNGKVEGLYFDSFGQPPPKVVEKFAGKLPYCDKDIQSLMNSACGWYCLAFLHFINASPFKSGHIYTDAGTFTDMFDDLSKSTNHLKNEFILKHFFQSNDPEVRKKKPIEVGGSIVDPNSIVTEDADYVKV
jgi:hypothetical protein